MEKFWNLIKVKVNGLVNHFGSDKCLHFLVGAWLTSMVTPLGFWWVIGMIAFVVIISYVKEVYVDDVGDKIDMYAGIYGSVTSFVIWFLIELIKMI